MLALDHEDAAGSLDKCIALAATSHRVPVEVNKLQFAEWLEDLFDVGLSKIEVERSNIKPREVMIRRDM